MSIFDAAKTNNLKILDEEIDDESCNYRDEAGNTPLHLAVENGSLEAARFLIQHGALVDLKNRAGYTPLHVAALRNQLECCKLLVYCGADPEGEDSRGETAISVVKKDSPLHKMFLALGKEFLKISDEGTGRDRDWWRSHPQNLRIRQERIRLLGNDAFKSNQLELAITAYSAALHLRITKELFSNRSIAYLRNKQPRKAVQDARHAIYLDRKWSKGWHRMGAACKELGWLHRARNAFRQAAKLETTPETEALLKAVRQDLKLRRKKAQSTEKLTGIYSDMPDLEGSDSESDDDGEVSDSDAERESDYEGGTDPFDTSRFEDEEGDVRYNSDFDTDDMLSYSDRSGSDSDGEDDDEDEDEEEEEVVVPEGHEKYWCDNCEVFHTRPIKAPAQPVHKKKPVPPSVAQKQKATAPPPKITPSTTAAPKASPPKPAPSKPVPAVETPNKGDTTLLELVRKGNFDAIPTVIDTLNVNIECRDSNRRTPLILSVDVRHYDMCQYFLKRKAQVDAADDRSMTALHYAVKLNDSKFIVLLVNYKANMELLSTEGLAPLHIAAQGNYMEAAKTLVEKKANVNIKSSAGLTPLHLAAGNGHVDMCKFLLSNKAQINSQGNDGETALTLACEKGYMAVSNLLLERSSNVNLRLTNGCTALWFAARGGFRELVELLLTKGAQIDTARANGVTPLWIACHENHAGVANMLLDHRANMELARDDGWTPLHVAASLGRKECVGALLRKGASADKKDSDGKLPWERAKMGGFTAIAKELEVASKPIDLVQAASIGDITLLERCSTKATKWDEVNKDGITPLIAACKKLKTDTVKWLLANGASPNARDKSGRTPLAITAQENSFALCTLLIEKGAAPVPIHDACVNGNAEIVSALIAHGSLVNEISPDGLSPLVLAIRGNHVAVCRVLVENKANVNSGGKKGSTTPLWEAASRNLPVIVRLLLDNGADVFTATSGTTALQVAVAKGAAECVHILVEKLPYKKTFDRDDGLAAMLVTAAENGYLQVCKELLSVQAPVQCVPTSPLFAASKNGHTDIVKLLIDHKADINETRSDGSTPLLVAIAAKQFSVVDTLVDHGANPNAVLKKDAATALHLAARSGATGIALRLLKAGADRDALAKGDMTPLMIAAQHGMREVVKALLAADADATLTDSSGLTALAMAQSSGHNDIAADIQRHLTVKAASDIHLSSERGDTAAVKGYLESKKPVDAKNKAGATALMIAAANNRIDICRMLLSENASVSVTDNEGFTPLHYAARGGFVAVCSLLLERGANPSAVSKIIEGSAESGSTPLHLAAHDGHGQVISLLLSNKANVNVQRDDGATALCIAAQEGLFSVCTLLLDQKADPNIAKRNGTTPIGIAAQKNEYEIVEAMLQKGAHVDSENKDGLTALMAASAMGHLKMVKLLLDHGACVTKTDRRSKTAYDYAKAKNHKQVMEDLKKYQQSVLSINIHSCVINTDLAPIKRYVTNGGNINAKNAEGMTALHVAAAAGKAEIVSFLLDLGADPDMADNEGNTPLLLAIKSHSSGTAQMLMDRRASLAANKSGVTALHLAAEGGLTPLCQVLLSRAPHMIESRDLSGSIPLHLAAKNGHADVCKVLIEAGSEVDAVRMDQATPLTLAAHRGYEEVVSLLLRRGADASHADTKGRTAVSRAIAKKHIALSSLLQQHIDSKNLKDQIESQFAAADPDHEESVGITEIHEAAAAGNEEVVRRYLEQEGFPDVTDDMKVTPLIAASAMGQIHVVRILIDASARVTAADQFGQTALHVAAREGHAEVCTLLLDAGADPNVQSHSGHTPLHLAAQENRVACCTVLLDHGAAADAVLKDGMNTSVIHLAAEAGHVDVCSLLIREGINPNVERKDGITPLMLAILSLRGDCVVALLEGGASINIGDTSASDWARYQGFDEIGVVIDNFIASDVHSCVISNNFDGVVEYIRRKGDINKRNVDQSTPLHLAASYGFESMITLLLNNGGDIEARDLEGNTPLLCAVGSNQNRVFYMLMNRRANIHAKDNDGENSLLIACEENNVEVVTALLEAGIDVNEPRNDGVTPLWIAAQEGHAQLVGLLLAAGADPNAATRLDRVTPLMASVFRRQPECALLILETCDPWLVDHQNKTAAAWAESTNQPELATAIYERMRKGIDIFAAVTSGDLATVQRYIQAKGDINVRDTFDRTPLLWAAYSSLPAIANALLQAGAEVEVVDKDGYTPLAYSAQFPDAEVCAMLIARGADVVSVPPIGSHPLHIASVKGAAQACKLLLEAGASVEVQFKGATPLFVAAVAGQTHICQLLLDHFASINTAVPDGSTPLFIAAAHGFEQTCALLLNRGAVVDCIQLASGYTPLMIAIEKNKIACVQVLLNAGASLSVVSVSGHTPMTLAQAYNYTDIITLLARHQSVMSQATNTLETQLLKSTNAQLEKDLASARETIEKLRLEDRERAKQMNLLRKEMERQTAQAAQTALLLNKVEAELKQKRQEANSLTEQLAAYRALPVDAEKKVNEKTLATSAPSTSKVNLDEDIQTLFGPLMARERELHEQIEEMRALALEAGVTQKIAGAINMERMLEMGVSENDVWFLRDEYIRNPAFHPIRVDASNPGNPQTVVIKDDPMLVALRKKFGEKVEAEVLRIFFELEKYNRSGRYGVALPWSFHEDRPMTPAEIVRFLHQKNVEGSGSQSRRRRGLPVLSSSASMPYSSIRR